MNRDLTVGKPAAVLWRFSLPLFGSVLFQQLYNIADSLVAGKFVSQDALAAVGNAYELTLVYLAFAFGLNIGCSVITARYFGARDYKNLKTAVSTTFITSGCVCLLLMLLGFFLTPTLLRLINTPENIFSDCLLYLNIYIGGLAFLFFYNISTGIFSALGDSKTPFLFLAVSSVSNVGMDIWFVRQFQMGVAGVAWATFLCQGVSAVLAVLTVLRRLRAIEGQEKAPLFSREIFGDIIRIAIPSTLQQSFISVGNIIIQGVINSYGSDIIAGYSAAIKLNNMVITSFSALGNGMSNFTAQNLGAGTYERIRQGYRGGLVMAYCLAVPIIIVYMLFAESLVHLFMDKATADALETGRLILHIFSPFYLFAAAKLIADGVLRGAGIMTKFMFSTFTDLVLRVVLACILPHCFGLGSTGIWLAWPLGWVIAAFMSVLFYRTANYEQLSVHHLS